MFKKGDRVRHRRQIMRSGYCMGDLEDGEVEVQWSTGERAWVSEGQIETLPEEETADPVTLLLQGRHGGVDDLRQVLSQAIFSGQLSEMIYSMDATKTKFLAHQFKPVLSILDSPSQGILIADEVGLGKTIEAGLIWTELRFRKRARKLLVVCPAMLTDKWRMELQSKFGTEARIASAGELLNYLENEERDSRPVHAFICSLQGLRPPPRFAERIGKRPADGREGRLGAQAEDQRPFRDNSDRARLARYLDGNAQENQPLFDFVVIDEAHHLKNSDTSSNKLGGLLRPVADYMALLSATPINNRDHDLYSLLRVIDPAFYTSEYVFKTSLEANRPLVKAAMLLRTKRATIGDLCRAIDESSGFFTEFKLAQLPQFLTELRSMDSGHLITPQEAVQYAERLEGMNLFSSTISRTRKRDVEEARKVRRVLRLEVALSDLESEAYDMVTQAIRDYASANLPTPSFMLMTPQRQMTSCMYAAIRSWRERAKPAAEELDEDVEQSDSSGSNEVQPILEAVRDCVYSVDLNALYRDDSKYQKLIRYLKEHFSESPHDKVIVFSTFRGTLAYLQKRLDTDGIRALVVQGGINKSEVIEDFEKDPRARVLLASEVASEGVDLQFMSTLVNYDLPWNPMRIEQRIGRLDRFGQESAVVNIVNLYHAETIDDRIMELLDEKLGIFQHALGGLDEIIGAAIQKLSRSLTVTTLTDDELTAQREQTELALVNRKRHQEEIEAREGELIGLKDLLRQRIENAHSSQATVRDKDLVDYVRRFLAKYSERYQAPHTMRADSDTTHGYSLELPAALRQELKSYVQGRRLPSTALAQSGPTAVVFDCTVSSLTMQRGRERITQFHPLVDFINSHISAEPERHFWIAIELSAKELSADLERGMHQFVIERWRANGIRGQDTLRMALSPLREAELDATQLADGAGLLNSMRSLGATWTTVPSAGLDRSRVDFARRASISRLKAGFASFNQQHRDQNLDRYRTSAVAAEKKRDMQLQKMRERMAEVGDFDSRNWKAQRSRIENDFKKTISHLDDGAEVEPTRTTLASGLLCIV